MSESYIYIFKHEHVNEVSYKIGITTNVENRLKGLVFPGNLTVSKVFKFDFHAIGVEKYLHVHFESRRIKGEWFKLTDKDLDELPKILSDYKYHADKRASDSQNVLTKKVNDFTSEFNTLIEHRKKLINDKQSLIEQKKKIADERQKLKYQNYQKEVEKLNRQIEDEKQNVINLKKQLQDEINNSNPINSSLSITKKTEINTVNNEPKNEVTPEKRLKADVLDYIWNDTPLRLAFTALTYHDLTSDWNEKNQQPETEKINPYINFSSKDILKQIEYYYREWIECVGIDHYNPDSNSDDDLIDGAIWGIGWNLYYAYDENWGNFPSEDDIKSDCEIATILASQDISVDIKSSLIDNVVNNIMRKPFLVKFFTCYFLLYGQIEESTHYDIEEHFIKEEIHRQFQEGDFSYIKRNLKSKVNIANVTTALVETINDMRYSSCEIASEEEHMETGHNYYTSHNFQQPIND